MAVFTVTSLDDNGPGSLRSAINGANADTSGTPTEINFAVHGTIVLQKDLPSLTHPTVINGASALVTSPGALRSLNSTAISTPA